MAIESIINITITAICALALGFYFNFREKKIKHITDKKFSEIKDKYLNQIATRKVKEREEIKRLKAIAEELEKKHKQILLVGNNQTKKQYEKEIEGIVKRADEKAKQIEEEMRTNAKKFLEEQRNEVQSKMVDLVIGVSKKVLTKSLSYEEHKDLIESALKEMEGEKPSDS